MSTASVSRSDAASVGDTGTARSPLFHRLERQRQQLGQLGRIVRAAYSSFSNAPDGTTACDSIATTRQFTRSPSRCVRSAMPHGREEVGDHERGAGGEPIDHASVVVAPAAEDELIVKPQRLGARRQLARVVEDEAVDAVVGVLVRGVESLVDHQRLVEPVGLEDWRSGAPSSPRTGACSASNRGRTLPRAACASR